ncbi:MAG: anaerobic glycerol-3-phosphate dehydrogenase subunit A [Proteobacteria bacterium]|nr:anaerobic glycerol-3-phosphate dehydrogenase subunit A [Pseudomonadota bacterium]MBU4129283.1 anaerobic glycerol-3-phosphate dehydrogenase subunit A [Pseudomonadota bacterium]
MVKKKLTPQVLIIGAGVTGTGIARDLALRGISSLVIEKGNINDGASGRNHGLLHSGARYVGSDLDSASECAQEARILKRIAPHCIEETKGLYVAVKGDDESYVADFPGLCKKAGVFCQALCVKEALALEPGLSKDTIAVFRVDDASVDPFHLSLENMNQAIEHGAVYYSNCQAMGFSLEKKVIRKVSVQNCLTGECFKITPRVIINATGAWAGMVAQLAGIGLDMIYSKGSLLVTHNRLTTHVINRLRPAADGDILVPGRTVSIFGTTSVRLDNLESIRPEFDEIDFLIDQGAQMVPGLETARYIRAYAGVRPLVRSQNETRGDDRTVSRGFYLFDHAKDGVDNFVTITGGKVTTYRLMAEKTADLAAEKLKISTPCTTADTPLMSKAPSKLIEAGMSVKLWAKETNPGDYMMCECEMVPKSHFKELILWLKQNRERADLNSLRIHSRLGKGACQGTFCSLRVTGFMYDEAYINGGQGLDNIKYLLTERFKGQKPVLWDSQLAQAELNEAMFCSFFGLDMVDPDRKG